MTSLAEGDRPVRVGDRVQFIQNQQSYTQMSPSRRTFRVPADEILEVTRVYNDSVNVRTITPRTFRQSYDTVTKNVSFQVDKRMLRWHDPDAPQPRKLGQKPEDTDEMIYVSTDDPGIQWLWEDMATFAEGKRWCSQYDELAAELGIPGRPDDHEVSITVNGVEFFTEIRAHSEAEALRLAYAALSIEPPA